MKRWVSVESALILLSCFMLTACEPPPGSELDARLAGYDTYLQELPRRFYEPGMGDLMHGLQLRHAKLWYAANAGNWALAKFELHEIEENLERVARWHPHERGLSVDAAIKVHMRAGSYGLEQILAREDAAAFGSAFDRLTQGCNSCHQATDHGFIIIRRPTGEPVSNQQWAILGGARDPSR
jgi:hypothetical protein